MRLIIPTIGTHLRLSADWTFRLFRERRNNGLRKRLSMPLAGWDQAELSDEITIPAGSILIVDRIYIRQQAEAFDSVTFRLHSSPDKRFGSGRFWAKLPDVNRIECELDPPSTPGLTGKTIVPATAKQPKPRFGGTTGYKPGARVVVRGYVKAGVGTVRRRFTGRGQATYEVALPLFVGKVFGYQRYHDGEYQPGITYGCCVPYTDMRLATDAEIAEQETKLAKGRKRRVTLARKALEALTAARAGGVLTDTEIDIIQRRNDHWNPRGIRALTGTSPHILFIELKRNAYGDAAKLAAIELAESASERWAHQQRSVTNAEHRVMAAVQQGYLDADDVRPALRLTTAEAVGGELRPLWRDGKWLDQSQEETAA